MYAGRQRTKGSGHDIRPVGPGDIAFYARVERLDQRRVLAQASHVLVDFIDQGARDQGIDQPALQQQHGRCEQHAEQRAKQQKRKDQPASKTTAILHPEPPGSSQSRVVCGSWADRKSTRLNSSHVAISYAVFCLKKKTEDRIRVRITTAVNTTVNTSSAHRHSLVLVCKGSRGTGSAGRGRTANERTRLGANMRIG